MIHYNSNNPEHMEARKNVKPLSVEEMNEVIETIKYFFRATESFASDEIIEKEKDLLQRLIYHYENLQHFYDVVGGWEAIKNIKTENVWGKKVSTCELISNREGWISVNDRLPESDGEYLSYIHAPEHIYEDKYGNVYTEEEIKDVFIGTYEGGEWHVNDLYREFAVTHWMPLPEPPKKHK